MDYTLSMNITETRKAFWINSFFISIVYFFIRRDDIRASRLDLDEMLTWNLAQMPWKDFFSTIYHDTQQPLYYALLKFLNYIIPFNNDELIRYPSLFIGLGTILLFYHYSSKYFDQTVAILAVIFLATHQEFKYLSTYARPYALLYFFILINSLSVLQIFYKARTDKFYRHVFFISSILICLTHYLGIFYFSTLLIALLIFKPNDFWKNWGYPKVIGTFVFSLFYISTIIYQFRFKHYLNWVPHPDKGLGQIADAFNPSSTMPLTLIIIVISAISFFIFKKFTSKDNNQQEILFLLRIPLIGITLFYLFSKLVLSVFIAKYFMIFIPFYLVLLCSVLEFYKIQKYNGVAICLLLLLIYFKGFEKNETLWKFDAKNFFSDLSKTDILKSGDKVYCNTPNMYSRIYTNYSEYYFKRDICSSYRAHDLEAIVGDFKYILNVKNHPKDPIYLTKIQSYEIIFSSRDLELLKLK